MTVPIFSGSRRTKRGKPKQTSLERSFQWDNRWNFWRLSHACRISKMRHDKRETSVSPEKNDMIEKKW